MFALKSFFCRYAVWYIVRNVGGISAFRLNNLVQKKEVWPQSGHNHVKRKV